jgi:alcohol dehydrogenase
MRTRAAVLREMGAPQPYAESKPIEIVELELDPPGPGEVLIKVGAAGLCHSDLSVINGSRPRVMPMALGHEAAGEVVEVGPGVESLAVGDHAVLAFVPACGVCPPCRAGRAALCEAGAAANAKGTLLSGEIRLRDDSGQPINHHLGVSAFSDYIVVSERSAVRIEPGMPWEIAALFGCAVLTGVGAAVKSAAVRPGHSVAVFGLGGVGLAALMGAVLAGAGTIVGSDPVPEKLELATQLGATHTVAAGPDAVEQIREATGGGADRVIETVGSAGVLAEAYAATARGGTTVTVGLPHPEQMLEIPAVSLVAEERTLKGSYLGSCVPALDLPDFIALHRAGRLPVEQLLTHTLDLEHINEGFDRLASGEAARQAIVF